MKNRLHAYEDYLDPEERQGLALLNFEFANALRRIMQQGNAPHTVLRRIDDIHNEAGREIANTEREKKKRDDKKRRRGKW